MGSPSTIGVIPDGNRRYAVKKGIPLHEGYLRGIKKAEEFMDYVIEETNIENVYFYTLSRENINRRSRAELSLLFRVFEKKAVETLADNRWDARIRCIGRLHELPGNVQEAVTRLERETSNNDGPTIILAIAYSGTAEVTDMVREVATKVRDGLLSVEDIEEEIVFENLYAPDIPPPDAIVRTSGECRLSGFLPLQSVYSEFVFYPKLWPELEREDIDKIYREIISRDRRFGK